MFLKPIILSSSSVNKYTYFNAFSIIGIWAGLVIPKSNARSSTSKKYGGIFTISYLVLVISVVKFLHLQLLVWLIFSKAGWYSPYTSNNTILAFTGTYSLL